MDTGEYVKCTKSHSFIDSCSKVQGIQDEHSTIPALGGGAGKT